MQRLYEINTRIWLRRFDSPNKKATLADVPDSYWDKLFEKGIDHVWLMGVWKTCNSTIEKYNFEDFLIKDYKSALKNWKREDVIGSPYAIDKYEINPSIGSNESLLNLKSKLNQKGIKLILDFIPNHFSADSSIIKVQKNIFLYAEADYYLNDPHTFYRPLEDGEIVFAHGRDPFFPAWQDTVQINYFSIEAREFMVKTLLGLTKYCNGVRCDMAMLALNNVFKNTWGGVLSKMGFEKPSDEFWKVSIEIVKRLCPEFLFIAEVYWDLEWELQQLGFDFTYDKKLTDRLNSYIVKDIKGHLHSEQDYQKKLMRFIENHDEERAITQFGKEKSKAAAVIISTIQGMQLYHDGQFEGKKIKLPVQLGKEPTEPVNYNILEFYEKLLKITNVDVFRKGEWSILEVLSSWSENDTYKNILAWNWKFAAEKRLVVINYSEEISTCKIKLDVRGYPDKLVIVDILNDKTFYRNAEEIQMEGLFIELRSYQSHILEY